MIPSIQMIHSQQKGHPHTADYLRVHYFTSSSCRKTSLFRHFQIFQSTASRTVSRIFLGEVVRTGGVSTQMSSIPAACLKRCPERECLVTSEEEVFGTATPVQNGALGRGRHPSPVAALVGVQSRGRRDIVWEQNSPKHARLQGRRHPAGKLDHMPPEWCRGRHPDRGDCQVPGSVNEHLQVGKRRAPSSALAAEVRLGWRASSSVSRVSTLASHRGVGRFPPRR